MDIMFDIVVYCINKAAPYQEVYDMKLKTRFSMSPTKKFNHTIESNYDGKVAFDEYVISVTHMIMIYVEREEKYILKMRSGDGEAKCSKGSVKPEIRIRIL